MVKRISKTPSNYWSLRRVSIRKWAYDLSGGVCIQCGAMDDLQFHHKDRSTKLFSLADSGWHKPKKELEQEILKCELLCKICHINLHKTTNHGLTFYRKGCRCDICKSANTENVKLWRKNKSR